MIFNELTYYALFLLPALLLFHGSARWLPARTARAVRPWVLAVFGCLFFVYFAWKHFGGFWGAATVGIFVVELLASRLYSRGARWCVFGILQAVFVLCAFKYLSFFSEVARDLAHMLHLGALPRLERLQLPLGVSFFTFEFIHIAADVREGKLERPRLAPYAAFIFFFPTLVAGPIKRFQDFEPQLARARFKPELAAQGVTRILAGLAKKHVIADTFGFHAAHLTAAGLASATRAQLVLWVLAYGGKIYFDFSGYSDIAIGSGYLFGIHIPENFNWPYASRDIGEFWRRWHMSLGKWIMDYVYTPLGGSRRGMARTMANLVTAFAVSGLWHGAAYNFVLWGLWHGVLVAVHRLWKQWSGRPSGAVWNAVAWALTFTSVMIGWGLFAMDTAGLVAAWHVLKGG